MAHIKDLLKTAKQKISSLRSKVKGLSEAREKADEYVRVKSSPQKADVVQRVRFEVSAGTVAKIVVVTLLLFGAVRFLSFISDILVVFFVSLLLSAALDPIVDRMEKRKVPRPLGVLIVYLFIFTVVGVFISQLIPLLASEIGQLALKIQDFIKNIISGKIALPSFLEGLRPALQELFDGVDISKLESYKDVLLKFAQKLSNVAGSLVSTLIVVFNGFLNLMIVLVLTFLMIIDEQGINKFLLSLFPSKHAAYIMDKNRAIKSKVGDWLRGQFTLALTMGFLTYVGLFIIELFTENIDFTLTLAMFSAVAEFLPVIGPFLTWIAAVLIVSNQSFVMVIWVTLLFIVLQQIEGNILVPVVMRKAVGLSPIFVIFGVLVGLKFLGILGIVLAVPVTATLAIFVKDYANKAK